MFPYIWAAADWFWFVLTNGGGAWVEFRDICARLPFVCVAYAPYEFASKFCIWFRFCNVELYVVLCCYGCLRNKNYPLFVNIINYLLWGFSSYNFWSHFYTWAILEAKTCWRNNGSISVEMPLQPFVKA